MKKIFLSIIFALVSAFTFAQTMYVCKGGNYTAVDITDGLEISLTEGIDSITFDKPKLTAVSMTYVDYDNPDTPVGKVDVAQAGYNKIANGEVGFGNTAWNCNWITYISVDASGIDGAAIKSVRLTADVSGSTDSKRNTTWGVGYNASEWSADMTYSTADRSITLIGTEFTTVTKSADVFETVTFDITPAFANGSRTATILVYETAAAGGYIKNVRVEVETADSELDAAKERAMAAVRALPAGDGLFRYSQEDIDAAIAAIEAAQTVEEVEAVEMPSVKLPAEDQAYLLSLATSKGTFRLNTSEGIKIAEEGTPVFLIAQDNGTYALATIGGEYVNYAGGDTWTLAATADAYGWTIAALADGGYTIAGKSGFLGTNTSDGNAAGSSCYGDKKTSNGNYIWNIEETETPAPAPEVYTVNIAEIENGTVTSDVSEAQAGETVTLTVTPAEGYEFETLTVTSGEDGTGVKVAATEDASVYTFTMPEGNVNVSATFAEISEGKTYYWYFGNSDPSTMSSIQKSPNEKTPGWFKIGTTLPDILEKSLMVDEPLKWWAAVPTDGGYVSVGTDYVTPDGSEETKSVFTENAFTINGVSYNMYARKGKEYTWAEIFKKTK